MQRFRFMDVSGSKDCLRCAALGLENSQLDRKMKLINDDLASVRFTCPNCDLVIVGVVSVEGNDGEEYAPNHRQANIRPQSTQPYARAALVNDASAPRLGVDPPKDFKTDAEALEYAYGKPVSVDDLQSILENGYPEKVELGAGASMKVAYRKISPYRRAMGERGEIRGFLVEYELNQETLFSRLHMETEGVPDVQPEVNAIEQTMLSACGKPPAVTAMPARPSTPRGPVGCIPVGAGMPARVSDGANSGDSKIRESLINNFR